MTRFGYTMVSYFAALFTLVAAVFHPRPALIWNASASAPMGLYLVRPIHHPVRGVLLVITPPASIARFADERHYLPRGVPLLKPVAAVSGQTVCRFGARITVNRVAMAQALTNDRRGRPLPVWQGCRAIGHAEVFVMNAAVRDSFDGRYFGPVPFAAVQGRARPIWTTPQSPHAATAPSETSNHQPRS